MTAKWPAESSAWRTGDKSRWKGDREGDLITYKGNRR